MSRTKARTLARLLARKQELLAREGVVEGGEREAQAAIRELAAIDAELWRANVAGSEGDARSIAQRVRAAARGAA
jgi:hypothetical protein